MAKRASQSYKVDKHESVPFDDALRQILKAPPKKSPKSGEHPKPQKPPKRGTKA